MLQQKMEDKHFVHEKDKKSWCDKLEEVQKQIHELKTKHVSEISVMNA